MPSSKGWRGRRDERTLRETPIGEVVDGLLRERVFARGLPIGKLAASWTDVVGPRMAAESAPVSLEAGVLVVAASSGPWGAQAHFLASEIRRRANQELGSEQVRTVRIVVRPEPRKGL
ncbi:MAG: DciA family protein [Candidatus Velamenicoccus archaeovorus]